MLVTKTYCDFCGKEITKNNWETSCNALYIKLAQSSMNPLEKYDKGSFQTATLEYKDICLTCIRKLSNGITKILDECKGERSAGD